MKKVLFLSLLSLLFLGKANAQLPDGSIAPDFTMKDINGVTRQLYPTLDSGKSVILDFFEVLCGPCWNYHETHSLAKAFNAWGPQGTDQLRIVEIEGIKSSVAQIRGTQQPTLGDWTAGEPFPFIATCPPNNDEIMAKYNVQFFPTVYLICPDRRIRLIGTADTAKIHSLMSQCKMAPADSLFLDLVRIDSAKYITCNNTVHHHLLFQNYGIKPINSVKVSVSLDGTLTDTLEWTGNLKTYGVFDLDAGESDFLTDGSHVFTYLVIQLNGKDSGFRRDTISRRLTMYGSWPKGTFREDFSRTGFPYDKWTIENNYPQYPSWERAALSYGGGLRIPFFNIPQLINSSLYLPGISLEGCRKPRIKFDIACICNNSSRRGGCDHVMVYASTNCGRTFNYQFGISVLDNETAPADSNYFIPTSTQWKTLNLDLPSLANADNVILMFSTNTAGGNNVYFRNIEIGNSTGIGRDQDEGSVSIYPQPARDFVTVGAGGFHPPLNLELMDLRGITVWSAMTDKPSFNIPLSGLAPGMYLLRIQSNERTIVRKILKE